MHNCQNSLEIISLNRQSDFSIYSIGFIEDSIYVFIDIKKPAKQVFNK